MGQKFQNPAGAVSGLTLSSMGIGVSPCNLQFEERLDPLDLHPGRVWWGVWWVGGESNGGVRPLDSCRPL